MGSQRARGQGQNPGLSFHNIYWGPAMAQGCTRHATQLWLTPPHAGLQSHAACGLCPGCVWGAGEGSP